MARSPKAKKTAPSVPDDRTSGIELPPINPGWKALSKVTEDLKGWRPAKAEFRPIRSVSTIFPALDRATRVRGYPLDRFGVVHGPSAMGKTELVIGLGVSFLERGHLFGLVDAEFTTPPNWLSKLMGRHADNPGFVGLRPKSYEQTVDAVREFAKRIAKMRDEKVIGEETSALIVVDSISRLVPEDFLAKIAKSGAQGEKGSVDGMSGRGAMILAKMNSDWLRELAPMLYHTGTTMIAIAREMESQDQNGPGYKVGGGTALVFDSSMSMRVTRSFVTDGPDKDVIGEKHNVSIWKSKVAGRDDKVSMGYFHTSNGAVVPEGFDRARDVFELGREMEIVKESGAWFAWGGKRWQGANKAVACLNAEPALLARLEAQVREGFAAEQDSEAG